MTEIENLKKTNAALKDTDMHAKVKATELKEDVKDIQQEIRILAAQKSCPALITASEEIKELKNQVAEMQDFQRNNLIEGQNDG